MTVNPFNVNRLYVIDLFVNGVHSKEEYRKDDARNRLFELVHNGWAVSASILDEFSSTLYISVYRPDGESI